MNEQINNLREQSMPLPITQAAIRMAQQFADEQPTQSKKKQVYYNTLAVYIVNNYMRMMGISTDLNASDSWNPVLRFCGDVADLVLNKLGPLECRPIRASENKEIPSLHIPLEVPEDRIGLIVVEIDEPSEEATLLGFTKEVLSGEFVVSQLQPMDELFEYIDQIENSGRVTASPGNKLVCLSDWLQDCFEDTVWQSFQELLGRSESNLAWGIRGNSQLSEINIRRGKVIDLGVSLGNQSVALVVVIVEEVEQQLCVVVQVYPVGASQCLPPDLRLLLHSDSWSVPKEIRARSQDIRIQTNRFWCEPGERFRVELALNEFSVSENFVV